MASHTVMTLCSSFTPKLATFNSPTPTLLPLPPHPSYSCSSSLPTPCLKASFGGISSFEGIRFLQTSRDFKCYASNTPILTPGVWYEIPEVEKSKEAEDLGKFAVDTHNETSEDKLTFVRVIKAQSQVVDGINYNLWIEVRVGENAPESATTKVYEAFVFVSPPVPHKELKEFGEFVWAHTE